MADDIVIAPSLVIDKILIIDDDPFVRDIILKCLQAEGYVCTTAPSAEAALELLSQEDFSLIISDIMMPGKSGIELLSIVRERYPDTAVIMVTAVDDRATAVKALHLGAYGYVIKPFDLNEIVISVVNALERRRLSLTSKEYEVRLEHEVKERTEAIRHREEEICLRLTAACEYRDIETGTHNRRIGLYAFMIADHLGWGSQIMDEIRIAACMHDIGKIGVPDNILLKTSSLTDEEFEIIKTHTTIGAKILSGSEISLLQMAHDIALSHHEKWDGTGYPEGRAGEAIPPPARIVSILDVYDALVHKRVYRPAIPEDIALKMMEKDKGTHFDPHIFDAFIAVLPKIRQIRIQFRDEE
ncbi:MAG: response regulator [Desulfobacterota bacterium]|nr:response regulator [Thermodesulfobacteriota bacterium]